jgi:UDP-glucose 4-epimerase
MAAGRWAVVTGGAGFIGSHLVEALIAREFKVRVIDNLVTGFESNLPQDTTRYEFHRVDVCDANRVRELVAGASCVFHQAALASVPMSLERPLEVNRVCVEGTLAMLEAARANGVRRFVYAASSSCYGDSPYSAKRETDLLQPLSPYAAAKLAGEHYCRAYFHSFGMETVCLRYFNVFGPRQDPKSPYSAVIPLFITAILGGQRPQVYGDGQQSRDFTYVANVVDGNLRAMTAEGVGGRVFNMADGRSISLLQLLDLLGKLLGRTVLPEFLPPRAGDVRDSKADIAAAVRDLGYLPPVEFGEGLARSIDYYRKIVA